MTFVTGNIDDPALAAFAYHGGALDVAQALFPDARKPWLDLSTGINPDAYPLPSLISARLGALAIARSVARARSRRRAPLWLRGKVRCRRRRDARARACACGLVPARSVGILSPTYAGHERLFRALGVGVERVASVERLAEFERAVVVNPNNPDGRMVSRATLLGIAEAMPANGLILVDEAFADFDDGHSVSAQAGQPKLVVLRSFGKTFGLAGLRLSFALASPDLAERLRAALGAWPVSGPAIAVAGAAFADDRLVCRGESARQGQEPAGSTLFCNAPAGRFLAAPACFALRNAPTRPKLSAVFARRGY